MLVPYILSMFLLCVGLGLFVIGFFWLSQKRLIDNTPTSKIRSIAMGQVEICGEVIPAKEKILKSPFSEHDCVYYRYTVEEYRHSGKHSRWVTIKKDERREQFYLEDDTGKVLIDPNGARIDTPRDYEFQSGLGKDPPESVKRFLEIHNMRFEGALFGINKTMRFREWYIPLKEKLYIMGTAGDNPYVDDARAKQGVEDVMIQKGKYEKFYYISDKTEKKITQMLAAKAYVGIGMGAVLFIIGIYFLLMIT